MFSEVARYFLVKSLALWWIQLTKSLDAPACALRCHIPDTDVSRLLTLSPDTKLILASSESSLLNVVVVLEEGHIVHLLAAITFHVLGG